MISANKIPLGNEEKLGLGIALAIIQIVVFFSFIYACSFHAEALGQDKLEIGIPLSFLWGLSVIVCGALLTAVYVVAANYRES
ncbi:MAG TPA: DUF485 domain-containing protein [Pseudomonas sp.]|uniref:DUF485 domain-containing protein n=1 Tax=Pseudomonas sp. TaxID=306 RepID=UPI002EDA088B